MSLLPSLSLSLSLSLARARAFKGLVGFLLLGLMCDGSRFDYYDILFGVDILWSLGGFWEDCFVCVCGFLVVCVCYVQVEEEIKKEELARRKRCEEETKIEREEIKCH